GEGDGDIFPGDGDLPRLARFRPAAGAEEIDPRDAALDGSACLHHGFDLTLARVGPWFRAELAGRGAGGGDAELEASRLVGGGPDVEGEAIVPHGGSEVQVLAVPERANRAGRGGGVPGRLVGGAVNGDGRVGPTALARRGGVRGGEYQAV